MSKRKTFGERIANWDLLNTNLKPHLTDMPHLQALQSELDALIQDAKALDSEQEAARGAFRDFAQRRRATERRGETLRSRLAAHLKGSFGFTSEQLIPFGLSPLKRRVRRRAPEAPAPPTPPPITPT